MNAFTQEQLYDIALRAADDYARGREGTKVDFADLVATVVAAVMREVMA